MSRRVGELAAALLEDEIDKQANGDQVWFEIAMMMRPNAQNPQIPEPILLIAFWLKGALLDSVLYTHVVIDMPTIFAKPDAENMVRNVLEGLRNERSRSLSITDSVPAQPVPIR